jgi:hypothetical protein
LPRGKLSGWAEDRASCLASDQVYHRAQVRANFGTDTFVTDVEEIQADVRQQLEAEIAATSIQHSAKVPTLGVSTGQFMACFVIRIKC